MNIINRFKKYGAVAALVCGFISPLAASQKVLNAPLVNEPALAYSNIYTLNLSSPAIDLVSFQAVYGSATIAAVSLNDGTQSTATITVTDNTKLSTATASDFVTFLTTKSLSGTAVTINGITLTEGVHWFNDVLKSSWTARSFTDAVNAYVPGIIATRGETSSVVFTSATAPGSYGNNITATSNTSSITVNTARFTGGLDNARISVNGIPLTCNTDWFVGASALLTGQNIAAAMRASTAISAIVTSTAPAVRPGVVMSTSVIVGTAANYSLVSSTQAALTVSNTNTYYGGTNSAFTVGSPVITKAHSLTTAFPVLYSTGSAVAVTPFVTGTTYYAIPLTATTFELSDTSTGAVAGVYLTVTSSSPATTTHNYTLTPSTFTGTFSFKWQASNDNVNWTDLTTPGASATQATYVYPSTSTIVDLGAVNYGWVRANVTAPPNKQGGVYLKITPNAKNTTK